jgi:hypothetical protein
MKPFDLEKALAGEPVVTRSGSEVLDIAYFPNKEGIYKVCAIIDGDTEWYTTDGNYYQDKTESYSDLFIKEPLIESWVNLYQSGSEIITGASYKTEELAKQMIKSTTVDYIKTIKITNEL